MDVSKILFLDTESDPITKKPECIQYLYGEKSGIVETFDQESFNLITDMWNSAEAVLFYNAPYDLGVLSICYPTNGFKWHKQRINGENTGSWDLRLFNNRYQVRKIAFFRNMIKPMNRTVKEYHENMNVQELLKQRRSKSFLPSTPVIDLLKLWSILIKDEEESISLKALIKRELHKNPIEYTPENAKTDAYRLQDVFCLRELTEVFFKKIEPIENLKEYNAEQWGYIKTPATFTKLAYAAEYPELKDYKDYNDKGVKGLNLFSGLEHAYHGGITLSFYRGVLENTGWVDISGAYSKAIQVLNTDQYLKFDIRRIDDVNKIPPGSNVLYKARVNFLMKTINKSLKLFKVKNPALTWIWADDIKSCYNLYPQFKYEVVEAYEFIPLLNVEESIPTKWDRLKGEEKSKNGKTTLYQFYKYLSNTSYGIKAQRRPFETIHTNMVIAGMITAKVHFILTSIIMILKENGCMNLYNDTDSSCFLHPPGFDKDQMNALIDKINERIDPFKVEGEGFNKRTYILSLKRYVSERGSGKDKIRLHGKGRYNVRESEIYDYVVNTKVPNKKLQVKQLAANTPVGMKQLTNLFDYLKNYKHPFMFETNIDVDPSQVTIASFFNKWYFHIDTKTSFQKTGDFYRDFHIFKNIHKALKYFEAFRAPKNMEYTNLQYRFWDDEIYEDFGEFE